MVDMEFVGEAVMAISFELLMHKMVIFHFCYLVGFHWLYDIIDNLLQDEVLLQSSAEMWVSDTHIGQGVGHLKVKHHQLTSAQSFAVVAPPVVAEMKKEFIYQDPGDVAGPVFPEAMPVDDICPGEKTTIEEIMDHQRRSIPSASPSGHSPFSVSPWGSVPPTPVSVVVPLMSLAS